MPRKYTQTELKLNWLIYGNMPQPEYVHDYEPSYEQYNDSEHEAEYDMADTSTISDIPFYTEELANTFAEVYNSGALTDFNLFDLFINMS